MFSTYQHLGVLVPYLTNYETTLAFHNTHDFEVSHSHRYLQRYPTEAEEAMLEQQDCRASI
jgi:hypothetical protein